MHVLGFTDKIETTFVKLREEETIQSKEYMNMCHFKFNFERKVNNRNIHRCHGLQNLYNTATEQYEQSGRNETAKSFNVPVVHVNANFLSP